MLITRTLNKKLLEAIIHESFLVSPDLVTTEALLDALKHLGFHYATSSGLSINIEDLKTPIEKDNIVHEAEQTIERISEDWEAGHRTSGERFQAIIDLWAQATEHLKGRIVKYYQNLDPLSSLYVMAFSGARGNMSQVGQLVGMRGLMADQSGKIIDSPIQANFREGLASIDYIISSYGARKGLVDTALKTAEAGYLTRRLIYVGQKSVIRYLDCHTTAGVTFLCTKEESLKALIGRFILSTEKIGPFIEPSLTSPFETITKQSDDEIEEDKYLINEEKPDNEKEGKEAEPEYEENDSDSDGEDENENNENREDNSDENENYGENDEDEEGEREDELEENEKEGDKEAEKKTKEPLLPDFFMTEKIANELSKQLPLFVKVRSILTCECRTSVCQKCYGWDLSRRELVDLGDAVGIIAAQSIGEPATQLTMRTFHTGGVFSAAVATNQMLSPVTGRVTISNITLLAPSRTPHGEEIYKTKGLCELIFTEWQGEESTIFVPNGFFLYVKNGQFLPKGYPIAEPPKQTLDLIPRRYTPVSTPCSGRVLFENIALDTGIEKTLLELEFPVTAMEKIQQSLKKYDGKKRKNKKKARTIQNREGRFLIIEETLFSLPSNAVYAKFNRLSTSKTLATLKIVSPFHGFIQLEENTISILNGNVPVDKFSKGQRLSLDLDEWKDKFVNCTMKVCFLVKNHQYVDEQTTLALFYYHPNSEEHEGEVYSAKFEPAAPGNRLLYIVPERNIWFITTEQVNNLTYPQGIAHTGYLLHDAVQGENSGIFRKREGLTFRFQATSAVYLAQGTKLYCQEGDFLPAGVKLAFTIRTTQQTQDIIQGLPKLDKLIEAGRPKKAALLANRPGLILSALSFFTAFANRFDVTEDTIKAGRRTLGSNPRKKFAELLSADEQSALAHLPLWRPKIKRLIPFPADANEETQREHNPLSFKQNWWPQKVRYCANKKTKASKKQRKLFRSFAKKLRKKQDMLGVARFGVFDGGIKAKVKAKAKDQVKDQVKVKVKDQDWHTKYVARSQKQIMKNNLMVLEGQPMTEGYVDPHELLSILCECAHYAHDLSTRSLNKKFRKRKNRLNQKISILDKKVDAFYKKKEDQLEKLRKEEREKKKKLEKLSKTKKQAEDCPEMKKLENELKELEMTRKRFVEEDEEVEQLTILKKERRSIKKKQVKLGQEQETRITTLQNRGYQYVRDVHRNLARFRIILANSIISVYSSQGVNIASKHIEIIVRQLSCKARVIEPNCLTFKSANDFKTEDESCENENENNGYKKIPILYKTERISLFLMTQIYLACINSTSKYDLYNPPTYEPVYLSATRTGTTEAGFLTPAGFQETKRVLSKAALHGDYDLLLHLKENIIVGRFIPAGTTFFKKKNTLDEIYFFKDTKNLQPFPFMPVEKEEEEVQKEYDEELEGEDLGEEAEYQDLEEEEEFNPGEVVW